MAGKSIASADHLRYYHLERYVFTDVNRRFRRDHSIGAFDLFSIVIWKANRAKSKVAKRLRLNAHRGENLERVARRLTSELHKCATDKDRLVLLRREWQVGLAMSSAILSVCWPDRFSIYDERVCEELGDFERLKNITRPDRLWLEYSRFLAAVRKVSPRGFSLRDCDRYLWGRSAAKQLEADIRAGFPAAG